MKLDYGKKIVHESYFDGQLKSTKTEYSVPVLVTNKNQALAELMNCIEMLDRRETDGMTISIDIDTKTGRFKRITKTYTVIK